MEATTRITHAATDRFKGLAPQFHGIPKGALRAVFGNELGQQIWKLARPARRQAEDARTLVEPIPAKPIPTKYDTPAAAAASGLDDGEIVRGMIGYVCRRAAETLAHHNRQAKAIGLKLTYSDGIVSTHRTRLAQPTGDAQELAAAAVDLFYAFALRKVALESVHLTTTTLQAEDVTDHTPQFVNALAPAY